MLFGEPASHLPVQGISVCHFSCNSLGAFVVTQTSVLCVGLCVISSVRCWLTACPEHMWPGRARFPCCSRRWRARLHGVYGSSVKHVFQVVLDIGVGGCYAYSLRWRLGGHGVMVIAATAPSASEGFRGSSPRPPGLPSYMSMWRNFGIRAGFRCQCPKGIEGSSPSMDTG